jgi:hypothetical protein
MWAGAEFVERQDPIVIVVEGREVLGAAVARRMCDRRVLIRGLRARRSRGVVAITGADSNGRYRTYMTDVAEHGVISLHPLILARRKPAAPAGDVRRLQATELL